MKVAKDWMREGRMTRRVPVITFDAPLKHNGGITQRAVGHGDRNIANDVIDDLVPHQDLQWIGAGIAVDVQRNDWLAVRQILLIGNRRKDRLVD